MAAVRRTVRCSMEIYRLLLLLPLLFMRFSGRRVVRSTSLFTGTGTRAADQLVCHRRLGHTAPGRRDGDTAGPVLWFLHLAGWPPVFVSQSGEDAYSKSAINTHAAAADLLSGLFYENALIDHENAFRNVTKTQFETLRKRMEKVYKNAPI